MDHLYVNPEALGSLAHPYYAAGENYQHIGDGYDELLPKFKEGFGDDDTGHTFYQHFIRTAEELGLRVRNLENAMVYCGDGLTQTSELYGQAEEDATQTATAFQNETDEILAQPGQGQPARLHSRLAVKSVHPDEAREAQPLRMAVMHTKPAVVVETVRVNEKGERVDENGEPLGPQPLLEPTRASLLRRKVILADEVPEQGQAQPALLRRRQAVMSYDPDNPPPFKRLAVRSVHPDEVRDGEQGVWAPGTVIPPGEVTEPEPHRRGALLPEGEARIQHAELHVRTPLLPEGPIDPDAPRSGFVIGEVVHVEARRGDDDPNPVFWTEARFVEGHGLPPDGFRPGFIAPDEPDPGVAPTP
ncbi:hypothetical protein [Spirilliplanes yamanashiensis]|uniref:Uncharacterized protein n=1 Tax=Spirilliplanes yamanashiensis TaxID=42233 RepID=A0A8J3Y718_9ACTN|nr:hypothetical protein [Spirilliplanes yamanashiensis]MDP9817282.1 hypothetical protein [Spirilliplanes yamanashiensis]GIJ03066.1 hypothetical protein Sya03_24180 [Spirilliplanes yamanashiensis]